MVCPHPSVFSAKSRLEQGLEKVKEISLALPFFAIGMKTDLFHSFLMSEGQENLNSVYPKGLHF